MVRIGTNRYRVSANIKVIGSSGFFKTEISLDTFGENPSEMALEHKKKINV